MSVSTSTSSRSVQEAGGDLLSRGSGVACLPWLTGFVSTQQHSLRAGLAVPMAATMIMVTLSLLLPLSLWSRQDAAAGSVTSAQR